MEDLPVPADELELLLELDALTDLPDELWEQTRHRALGERPAGRPIDAPIPARPVDAFRHTIADLRQLLDDLGDEDWHRAAHPEHGRVRDVVAHLVGVERLLLAALQGADPDAMSLDHVAATREVVGALATTPAAVVASSWHELALRVAGACEAAGPAHPIRFHDLPTSTDGLLVMRTFELWAHSEDICAATGRPRPRLDDARMALLAGRLMGALPFALAYRSATEPGRTVRFVLTGPAGGCHLVALDPGEEPGEPDVTLVVDAVDLCRVAARRLAPTELATTVEGDGELAARVLAATDAFARD